MIDVFEMFGRLKKEAHETAGGIASYTSQIAKIHADVSRALISEPAAEDAECQGLTEIEVALADAVIDIMVLCEEQRYRLPEAILTKMRLNKVKCSTGGTHDPART